MRTALFASLVGLLTLGTLTTVHAEPTAKASAAADQALSAMQNKTTYAKITRCTEPADKDDEDEDEDDDDDDAAPSPSAAPPSSNPDAAPGATTSLSDIVLCRHLRAADLDRLKVGDQGGLLKITGTDRERFVFVKADPSVSIKGLDSVYLARVKRVDRRDILDALQIRDEEVPELVDNLVTHFDRIPQREAAALLGVLGADHEHNLRPHSAWQIRHALAGCLDKSTDPHVRRQAVLALAVTTSCDDETVQAVLHLLETSHNSWETFTAQQFFQHHRNFIRSSSMAQTLRERLESSGSPYVSEICAVLDN